MKSIRIRDPRLEINLTHTSEVTETEKNIPNFSNFLKKTNLDSQISTALANLGTKDDITTDVDFVIANEKKWIEIKKKRQKLLLGNNYFNQRQGVRGKFLVITSNPEDYQIF